MEFAIRPLRVRLLALGVAVGFAILLAAAQPAAAADAKQIGMVRSALVDHAQQTSNETMLKVINLADDNVLATVIDAFGADVLTPAELNKQVAGDVVSAIVVELEALQPQLTIEVRSDGDMEGAIAPGDTCATCFPVGEGSFPGATSTNVVPSGPPNIGLCPGAIAVPTFADWYCYTPTCTGTATVSLCAGVPADSVMSAHSGCVGPTVQLGCDDDTCATANGLGATFSYAVTAGVTNFIKVHAFSGTLASYLLDITCSAPLPNDPCSGRIPISNGVTAFDRATATTDGALIDPACDFPVGDQQIYHDIWYNYIATCSGTLAIDTCGGAALDTRVAVYDGCACLPGSLLGCNDDSADLPNPPDACLGTLNSSLEVPVTAGNCYKIRVGSFAVGTAHAGIDELSLTCTAGGVPPILAGVDLFHTPAGSTTTHEFNPDPMFGGTPIPAGFFSPGSNPFSGSIALQGGTLNATPSVTPADTIVERLADCDIPNPGDMCTIPIEIVALNLVSVSPITVTGAGPNSWNVEVCLSALVTQPVGSMTITRTIPNGGTFDSTLPVRPKFIFRENGNPGNMKVLDTGGPMSPSCTICPLPAVPLQAQDVPFVNQVNLNPQPTQWPGGGTVDHDCNSLTPDVTLPGTTAFHPGIMEGGNGAQRKVLTDEQAMLAEHGIQVANPKVTGVADMGGVNPDYKTPPMVNGQTMTLPLAKHFNVPVTNWAGVLFNVAILDPTEMTGAVATGTPGIPPGVGTVPPSTPNSQWGIYWDPSAPNSGTVPPLSVPIVFATLAFTAANTTGVNSDFDAKVEAWNIFHVKPGAGSTIIRLEDSDYVYAPLSGTPAPGNPFGCPTLPGGCPTLQPCTDPHPEPGCFNSQCCDIVCGNFPHCCQATWDSTCASFAQNVGGPCFMPEPPVPCTPPSIGDGNWVHIDFTTTYHLPSGFGSHYWAEGPTRGNIGVEHAGPVGCGNGMLDAGEQCDPPGSACPGGYICNAICQCPFCGDNVVNGPEVCDGTDDAACPGSCTAACNCPIPTLSEWGAILMTLLLLTGGSVVFSQRRASLAGIRGSGMTLSSTLFMPPLYFKVLAATLTLVAVGFAGSIVLFGELTTIDITGSLLCAPLFAYLVHLWITPRNN